MAGAAGRGTGDSENVARLSVALVGAGGIGAAHLKAIKAAHFYRLVAICDAVPARVDALAGATGVPGYTTLSAMLEDAAPDVVVVATPPATHFDAVRAALEAGCHVYCEKPLTPTVSQADHLAQLSAARGRKLQVGFQNRFGHAYRTAHEACASGGIGQIYRADLYATAWFRAQAYFEESPWRARWDGAAGGVLISQSIHQLDAYAWIAGLPARVDARAWRAGHDIQVEDDIMAMMEFPGGARGVMVTSTLDAIGSERLEFHGTLGSLIVEGGRVRQGTLPAPLDELRATGPAMGGMEVDWTVHSLADGELNGFDDLLLACHRDLFEAVRDDRLPLNHAGEAARSLELCNAAYMSAALGEPVALPLDRGRYDDVFAALSDGRVELPRRPGEARAAGATPALAET